MSKEHNSMRWLLTELPVLREKQIIDAPTHDRLNDHYRARLAAAPSPQNLWMMVLVGLGACMIAGGVISLLAYNWDMLPKACRIFIALLPLLGGAACGAYTIVNDKDARWRECSAVLTMAGVACFTALISQIYHTGGTLRDFIMLVLLVTLPLLYVFRSYFYAGLYCFGLFFLEPYDFDLVNWAFLAGVLPFLFYHLFRDYRSAQATFARYLTLPLLIFVLMSDFPVLSGLLIIAATVYIGGIIYSRKGIDFFRNPWLFCGWIVLTVALLISTYTNDIRKSLFYDFSNCQWIFLLPILLGGLLPALLLCTARRNGKRVLDNPELLVVAAAYLLPYMALFLDGSLMRWLCNLYLLCLGITLTASGIRHRSLLFFNAGIIQIAALATCRFFDSEFSMLVRGTAFIVLGAAFIVANVIIGRRFKKNAGGEA
jgi:hypothetical protein